MIGRRSGDLLTGAGLEVRIRIGQLLTDRVPGGIGTRVATGETVSSFAQRLHALKIRPARTEVKAQSTGKICANA